MQVEKARKQAMMDELKHYINGKFAEFEKKFDEKLASEKAEAKPLKKALRERAVRE